MSNKSVMLSNHLILCCSLLLLPSIFPCIRVFSNKSAFSIRWPKYWSFSFSISPSNEYSRLILIFRIDWFDLRAFQETLKNLLQHHNSKASIIWRSAFFMVQLSHLYMTNGKTIALTIRTFVGKVMSLLFNTLSRSVSFPSKEQAKPTLFVVGVLLIECKLPEGRLFKPCDSHRVYIWWPNKSIFLVPIMGWTVSAQNLYVES